MYFSDYIGMQPTDDFHEAVIDTLAHHQNPTGNINGGAIISLADNLATGVANHYYREKFGGSDFMVGVDLHASMLANQVGGRITARAEPVRIGRRISVIRTRITGDNGRLLADISTTHVPVSPS